MNALVLWHGWGMHPAAWDGLAAQLASQHRITPRAQALPGYAGTPAPTMTTPDALVDALLADVATPITLCGWSLGALLALHAAQRHPDRIARLILIGATPSFVQRQNWPHGMTPQVLAEFTEAVENDPKTALKRFIGLFNQNDVNGRSIGRALAQALATDELPPAATLAAGLALLRDSDLRALAPNITQPTLLLHGAHDPLMPLAAAEWLAAALPHARLEVLPDAAHAPFLSDPARCAALMADFIDA
ncbi:MAG: alpha/beta fold hydrolase [Telluria sp.]|nr:alpha/beta fold hydrolase [Telluria sp.]